MECLEFGGTFTWDGYGSFVISVADEVDCMRPFSVGWELADQATMTYAVSVAALTNDGPQMLFQMAVSPVCAAFALTSNALAPGSFLFSPADGSSPTIAEWIALHAGLFKIGSDTECKVVEDFYNRFGAPHVLQQAIAEATLPLSA